MADDTARQRHRASSHCGALRLEGDAALTGLLGCNCSTCGRSGFLHWKVPSDRIRLLSERQGLSTYIWRNVDHGHHFCRTCGTAMLRTGYPDGVVSVNARCVEGIDVFAPDRRRFDGRMKMPPGPMP